MAPGRGNRTPSSSLWWNRSLPRIAARVFTGSDARFNFRRTRPAASRYFASAQSNMSRAEVGNRTRNGRSLVGSEQSSHRQSMAGVSAVTATAQFICHQSIFRWSCICAHPAGTQPSGKSFSPFFIYFFGPLQKMGNSRSGYRRADLILIFTILRPLPPKSVREELAVTAPEPGVYLPNAQFEATICSQNALLSSAGTLCGHGSQPRAQSAFQRREISKVRRGIDK